MKQTGLLRSTAWFENTQIPWKFIRILKKKKKVQNAYVVLANSTHRRQFKKYTPVYDWCTVLYNEMRYSPTDFQLKEEMYYKQSKNLFIPRSKLSP